MRNNTPDCILYMSWDQARRRGAPHPGIANPLTFKDLYMKQVQRAIPLQWALKHLAALVTPEDFHGLLMEIPPSTGLVGKN